MRGSRSRVLILVFVVSGLLALDAGQFVKVEFVRVLLTLPGILLLPGVTLAFLATGEAGLRQENVGAVVMASLATLLLVVVALAPLGVAITRSSVVISVNAVVLGLLAGAVAVGRLNDSESL